MATKAKKAGKATGKGTGKTQRTSKRTLISPKGDKRYVRRDAMGRFTESVEQDRSLGKDVKKSAKTKVKPGYGDKGDQAQKKSKSSKK
jgi:hypothetical protein